ncbi:unnamed protein product [Larinioides sclopetarius]|uniref:Cuticle protein 16.8 n=1 Tax=Larinioides sclopetarius TaxID=280406 RepID=A0AAV2AMB3_9ARAC
MFLLVALSCIIFAQAQYHGDIHHHHPQPYAFGYSVRDHNSQQHRHETGNGHGAVVGSYGFTDATGIARQVNYVADHAGFRAQVNTNEQGTANQNPAAVHVISHQPHVDTVVEPLHSHSVGVVAVPVVNGLGAGLVF